jgi:[acyl-carrier-protein] S-malonyltransferase
MVLAILCSGQGRQHREMFALTGMAPEASGLFAQATRLLSRDPRDIAYADSEETLYTNRVGQILCALQALAAVEMLRDSLPNRRVFAGYSVGEVAAWGAAGCLGTPETLRLIERRAEFMSAVSHPGEGLLYVRGLSRQAIDALCNRHDVEVAIINPNNAFVIGGVRAALEAFAADARTVSGTDIVRLQVEVASHTKLLRPASISFGDLLRRADVHLPKAGVRLLSGIDGSSVTDVAAGLEKLAAQISRTVDWRGCLQGCIEAGATAFLELGPGRALSQMADATYPDVPARSLDDFKTLDGVRKWLARYAPADPPW